MARKKLETILKMEDSHKKSSDLFSYILDAPTGSINWKKAKKEWERVEKKLKSGRKKK